MLKKILAISGKSGLFRLISQGKNCLIVESLRDGKKSTVHSLGGVMSMEDVAIYTEDDTVSMAYVFGQIAKNEKNNKFESLKQFTNDEFKTYFEKIVPNFDRDKVYVSDIKKTLSWYNDMVSNDLLELIHSSEEEQDVMDSNEDKL